MENTSKSKWEKAKVHFSKMSKSAETFAKRNEGALQKISNLGKLHLESSALNFKKEHLYHLIGKEYVNLTKPGVPSLKLKELMMEFRKIKQQEKEIKQKLRTIS